MALSSQGLEAKTFTRQLQYSSAIFECNGEASPLVCLYDEISYASAPIFAY